MQRHSSSLTDRTSWESLSNIIKSNELHLLGRDNEGERKYQEWSLNVKEKYQSISDVVYHNIFNCEFDIHSEKKIALKHTKRFDVVLRKNDFPYHLTDDISHYLLWSCWILSLEDVEIIIQKKLPNKEFMYFVNPPHLQSIKDIWHAHIFIK
jgi:hypothetical protein